MKYEDLSFTITNDKGMEVICDIVSVVPNDENKEEPYVVFTDYMLDDNNEFVMQYGKVIEIDGEYVLKRIDDEQVVNKIKEALKDEVVDYVNRQVQENMDE